MADALINSGEGDGVVKRYTLDADGTILVKGLKVAGVQVTIELEPPDNSSEPGGTSGTTIWKGRVHATPGRHTLVVRTGRLRGKELRQQIDVV